MHEFLYYCYGFMCGFPLPFIIAFFAIRTRRNKRKHRALKTAKETGTDYSAYKAPET